MRKLRIPPSWQVPPDEAVDIQFSLQETITLAPLHHPVRSVAGVDVCYSKTSETLWGGVAVFSYPDLTKVEEKWAKGKSSFPYIPGLLSFREIPILLEALKKVRLRPDLILCDGQGIAHPRGLGLATHLGMLLDTPTVGCAKSRLFGELAGEPLGEEKGSCLPLLCDSGRVGSVVRTRSGTKPLYVSPGFKIAFDESIAIALACCNKHRIPEPIRSAHLLVTGLRRREPS